jgi:hypothetical protein
MTNLGIGLQIASTVYRPSTIRFYHGIMRLIALGCLAACAVLSAQIIPFESNGLQYKTLTKGGVTVMFAYLPAHLKEFSIMQVSISNGSPVSWTVKPEDFSYRQQDGAVWQASTALSVVNTLLAKASRHDVIKLVTTYERGVYGNEHMQTTNGYESRREAALAEGVSSRLKAGAAASAIALVATKLASGESTDGALFFPSNGRLLGPGTLTVHTGGENFEFPSDGEPAGR